MLGIPTDRRRPADVARATSVYRFLIGAELTSALLGMAKTTRSSPFMILLGAYQLLLKQITGVSDVAVPTITFGRGHPQFDDTVGPFFNFIPLRCDLTGCETVRDVLARTRTTCIEAQTNEIPFAYILEEAPDLMATFGDDGVAVGAFQAFQNGPNGGRIGNLEYTELRRRVLFQAEGSDIPDGALWTMEIDPSGEIFGCLRFDSNQFRVATVDELARDFQRVLRRVVTTPDAAA
jgi:non-ribosomal peptide synthetase component F